MNEQKELLKVMTKEEVLYSIFYALYEKKISIKELTEFIHKKEIEVCNKINEQLTKVKQ